MILTAEVLHWRQALQFQKTRTIPHMFFVLSGCGWRCGVTAGAPLPFLPTLCHDLQGEDGLSSLWNGKLCKRPCSWCFSTTTKTTNTGNVQKWHTIATLSPGDLGS